MLCGQAPYIIKLGILSIKISSVLANETSAQHSGVIMKQWTKTSICIVVICQTLLVYRTVLGKEIAETPVSLKNVTALVGLIGAG